MPRDEHRFPGPEDLPSKGAFSSTFHLAVGAASTELSLAEEPDALPGMATPCASYRRVTGRFRFAPSAIPRACGVRSRSPFTRRGNRSFPCTLLWTRRSPASLQRCCRARMPFDFCNELSNVGSHSAGAIPARRDGPCGVARSGRRFSHHEAAPLAEAKRRPYRAASDAVSPT